MGSVLSSKPQPPEERAALQKEINKFIAENPVVIFSKTWCRTCREHRTVPAVYTAPPMYTCHTHRTTCHAHRMGRGHPECTRAVQHAMCMTRTGQVRLLRASKAAIRPLGRHAENSGARRARRRPSHARSSGRHDGAAHRPKRLDQRQARRRVRRHHGGVLVRRAAKEAR